MSDSTLAALSAASALTGSELIYGTQSGADVKITPTQIQTLSIGNNFTHVTGPATTVKTFTLPNADSTILTTNAAVTVAQGGTGASTFTTHGVLVGEGTGAFAALSVGATGTLLAGATGADPTFSATPTLGANGGTGGALTLKGSTSGSVALQVAAAAGTGTVFQLPATNGTSGWVLQTDGAGVTSWVAAAGGSPGGSSGQIQYNNSSAFGGTNLWVTDANTIEKYNLTNAQTIKLHGTRTDASNYSALIFTCSSSAASISPNTYVSGTSGGTPPVLQINFQRENGNGGWIRGDVSNSGIEFGTAAGNAFIWIDTANNRLRMGSDTQIGFTASSGNAVAGLDTVLQRGAAGIFQFASANSFSANGSVATSITSIGPTGANTTVQEWLTIKNASGTTRYIPCF